MKRMTQLQVDGRSDYLDGIGGVRSMELNDTIMAGQTAHAQRLSGIST